MADLCDCLYFLAMLTLDGHVLAPRRSRFALTSDTYEEWCLLLPRSGSFRYELAAGRGVARFGDVVICPPGGTLWRWMQTPTSFFHARFSTELELPAGCTRVQELDRLRADLALLETADDVVAAHLVTDIVLLTVRAHVDRPVDRPVDELIDRATSYLLEHFTSPELSLGELAGVLGISPAQLSRRFKAVHGVAPAAYLRRVRLQKARELLTRSDANLQTIAERCGYRSAFYFSRVFTHETGRPPSQYRAASRV
jgi:AraC-like DNA-binding protein